MINLTTISHVQEAGVQQEVESAGVPDVREEHCSLLPSRPLLFEGSKVTLWDGR